MADMWFEKSPVRTILGAFLALVFFVAVMPGTMAMPSPQQSHEMGRSASHCDPMKPVKDTGSPCKSMQVCAGLLGCFGLAAVVNDIEVPFVAFADEHVPDRHEAFAGRTAPPNNRPPIV